MARRKNTSRRIKVIGADLNPKFKFFKANGRFPKDLFFGFENEMVPWYNNSEDAYDSFGNYIGGDNVPTQYISAIDRYKFYYCKYEGSNEGIEMNSHPFTWNWLLSHSEVIDNIKTLNGKKKFFVDNNCGFHVHINRDFFKESHLYRMIKLWYGDPKFFAKISKRDRCDLYEWANPNPPTDEFEYYNEKGIMEYMADDMDPKRSALNFTGSNKTVEVRLFAGSLNPKLIWAYLEFILGTVLFTKKEYRESEITTKNLIKFMRKNKTVFSSALKLCRNPESFQIS